MPKPELTILNSMAGTDFVAALDQHVAWGIRVLDLKDAIFGKGISDLDDEEAQRAAALIRERDLRVYCLSSGLFFDDTELGQEHFRRRHLGRVGRLVEIARVLKPTLVRLLAARSSRRDDIPDSACYIRQHHPWLLEQYAEAAQTIASAGFQATLENEVGQCIFHRPEEVLGFFEALGADTPLSFTWDVQNLWQCGTFPTPEVYEALKPLIGYLHLKGGRHDGVSTKLRWASALEEASWPVLDITRRAIQDGVSPVICLNPSHGERPEGYDLRDVTRRDLEFLRGSMSDG